MRDLQRREFHESLLGADSFEDLPVYWQAAVLKAEAKAEAASRGGDQFRGAPHTRARRHGAPLLCMECDSDEASRSARQHGSGCRTDGLACNARP
jgi:hypothetical protein